jgi:hypothetical protein
MENWSQVYNRNESQQLWKIFAIRLFQIYRSLFDSWPYQIFWEVGGLEQGPLSLLRTIEELLEWKSSGSSLENRD